MMRSWTGREATALRQAMRLTNERFAARLDVSPRTVANWAANPEMIPRPVAQDRLDELVAQAPGHVRARFDEVTGTRREAEPDIPTEAERLLVAEGIRVLNQRMDAIEAALADIRQLARRRRRAAVPA